MADIFLSYASQDREAARRIAEALSARGYSVWWDRTIPPGRVFDEVIQEQLNTAKCVVVLWSAHSVRSNWVKTEASEAVARNTLVPALIEAVAPPIEFKRIQAANLAGWSGDTGETEFVNLLAAIQRLIESGPAPVAAARPEDAVQRVAASANRAGRRPSLGIWVLAAIALLAGAAALYEKRMRPGKEPTQADAPASTAVSVPAAGAPTASVQEPATATAVPSSAPPSAPAVDKPVVAAVTRPNGTATSSRMNLLTPDNGGQLLVASKDTWALTVDGKADSGAWVDQGQAVFGFKDDRAATFDTFAVLINATADHNVKDVELLAGNDSPTGRFESIGKFSTQNVRIMKQPYQEFHFAPVKAKYVKIKPLRAHSGTNYAVWADEFQLFGTLE
jgi:hypothetical protein